MDWATALADPTTLRERGLFVAEGRFVLARVLAGAAGGPDAIVAVLGTPAAARALDLERCAGDCLTVRTPTEMEALTGFNFHRGVLALVRRPLALAVDALIRGAITEGSPRSASTPLTGGMPQHFADRGSRIAEGEPGTRYPEPGTRYPAVLVVAEHLVDVDNVGSCFRNARAFGAACVLLDDRCPDPLYRKAVRTSLGAVLEVPWAQAPMQEILDRLDAAVITTVGLTPDGSVTVADIAAEPSAHAPCALVVGNEGGGLSSETRARCTHLARIPMAEGADSLNVATALAVALYEWCVCRR